MNIARIAIVVTALAASTIGVAGRAQNPDEQTVNLSLSGGATATGVLRVPSATRPPVVFLVTEDDAGTLAGALAVERVATLRVTTKLPEVLAQWISFLRNDERFPLVTVFAEGRDLAAGVIAGRAAR